MAMFSTFIAWQLMQWGIPYWGAFLITLAFSFAGGIVIERLLFKPLAKAPILTNRSEEHTSELQSHLNLVCRLLLEKKKTRHVALPTPHASASVCPPSNCRQLKHYSP